MKFIAPVAGALALALLPVAAVAEAPQVELRIGRNSGGSTEAYLRYVGRPALGPLQPVYGVSWSSRGEVWAGLGLAYTLRLADTGAFVRASIMPGLYRRGDGRDLGGAFNIRSGIDLGYAFAGGAVVTLSISHRSNANLYSVNPGMNTVSLGMALPLN
jgi:lipid A 3-O-deacylase